MNCSTPGLPVHHHLPEFTQTHVHWVGEAIQPSHPLSSPSPPAPNPSQRLSGWLRSLEEEPSTHLALNLNLALPLHPSLDHRRSEESGWVFLQCLLAAECPTCPRNTFLELCQHSEDFSARSAPKKVPLQEEFEQRKFPFLVLRFPAFQLFGFQPVPCLHPSTLTTMLIITLSCLFMGLCTFQGLFMLVILFDTETQGGWARRRDRR